MASLLHDNDLRYKDSFYYWAALLPHGFASVQLDDELLERAHSSLERTARHDKHAAQNGSFAEPQMKEQTRGLCRQFEEIAQAEQRAWCEELHTIE